MKKIFTPIASKLVLSLLTLLAFTADLSAQCTPDAVAPDISCPPAAMTDCDIGDLPPFATLLEFVGAGGTVSDICMLDTASFAIMSEVTDGNSCPEIVTRTYMVADTAGNTNTCVQMITVNDTEAPMFVMCPVSDTTTYVNATSCSANFTLIDPSFTENCTVTSGNLNWIDSNGNPQDFTIVPGMAHNYVLNKGLNIFTFTIEDECGGMAECVTNVTVLDTFPPEIICPMDMIVQLGAFQCDSMVMYAEPTATDLCPGMISVTQIDMTGLTSGSAFPIGTTTLEYEAVDSSGNTANCSFDITVLELPGSSIASISDLNISVDEVCSADVTPEMVLLGDNLGCLDSCFVQIYDEDGNEVANQFDGFDVGKSFTYRVTCQGNYSEGVINIEDKFPPQIACVNDTITCAELVSFPQPIITENCSNSQLVLLNETFEDVDCNDPELQQIIYREYQAIDAAGNVSNTCIQELSIAKFDIGTVDPPLNQNIDLECGIPFPMNADGAPDPIFYGSPRLGGMNLFPQQFLVCNLMVTYNDQTIPTSQNTISIVRTWDATNWYCGTDTTRQFVQVFNIADTQGPVMTCPADMSFSTSGFSCSAEVELPAISVSDVCADVVSVDIQYEGGFLEDSNGGLAALPTGNSVVTYIATDSNGNTNSCDFNVFVSDTEQPIPVCHQFTTVGLTNEGTAIVNAESFDDGSFDACGPVTFEVRRMNPNCDPTDAVWGPDVTFCCTDLGEDQQVVLRVTDESGNTNECMVIAEVQDKIPPILVQGLPDITLSCEFPFNEMDTEQFGSIQMSEDLIEPILLTADLVQFGGPATDGLVLGNCIELTEDEFTFSNFNSCGTGSATRIIRFENQQGLSVTDFQTITFVNPSPFDENDIDFPNNITFNNICDVSQTLPDNLPAGFDYPTFNEDACDQVGATYDDQFIDNSNGAQSCYKIIRTWTVIDWCQNMNGQFMIWESQQVIEVFNTIAPEITGDCTNKEYCSFDVDCGPLFVELTNSGTDDCTGEEFLQWTYMIDLDSDGGIDQVGNTDNASGTYPVGNHTINWILSDACGNEDVCSYTFEIKNCKAATPICLDNLTIGLTAMDTDNDGEVDTEMVMVDATYFDGGSYHVCGTPVQFSFSSDVNDTERMFDCDDIGEQPIQLWVTDINGNQDFCTTSLDVQDNNNVDFCPDNLKVDISGELMTEEAEYINKVNVVLEGGEQTYTTNETGAYSFVDMPTGGSYIVNPDKNIDFDNGVSTFDIILIQKHILGIELLNSPYKYIAADVNNNEQISGQDIIEIRKLILGQTDEFTSNTSWKLIDADHTFIDPMNPWIGEIPEEYMISDLQGNMIIDFTGVKIGDVNNSAQPNNLVGEQIDVRTNNNLSLVFEDAEYEAGQEAWIPVYASNFEQIIGFQFGATLKNGAIIKDLKGVALNLNASNYRINEAANSVALVWHESDAVRMDEETVLFEMLVEFSIDMSSENMVIADDQILRNESYDVELNVSNIEIGTRNDAKVFDQTRFDVSQNEPNPWMNSTNITINSEIKGEGVLRIMDMQGKVILEKTLAVNKGETIHTIQNTEILANGVLYYEFQLGDKKIMKKMILIE